MKKPNKTSIIAKYKRVKPFIKAKYKNPAKISRANKIKITKAFNIIATYGRGSRAVKIDKKKDLKIIHAAFNPDLPHKDLFKVAFLPPNASKKAKFRVKGGHAEMIDGKRSERPYIFTHSEMVAIMDDPENLRKIARKFKLGRTTQLHILQARGVNLGPLIQRQRFNLRELINEFKRMLDTYTQAHNPAAWILGICVQGPSR